MKRAIKDLVFPFLHYIGKLSNKNLKREIGKKDIKRILIFEGGGIGDLLRIFPAIDVLRTNFPDASISIVVAKGAKGGVDLYPGRDIFSEIFEYALEDAHRGILRKLYLVWTLRKRRYDMIYVPARGEGMREISMMAFLTGIPHRIGFENNGAGSFNTVTLEFRKDISISRQNLALLERYGLKVLEEGIRIEIPEDDIIIVDKLIAKSNISHLTVIHPGASWYGQYRMWSVENYILLIKRLLKEFDGVVILTGSKNEEGIGTQICNDLGNQSVINMMGKTTVSQTAAIIRKAHLFIGNDSGPMHIALALKTPTVGIFGPTSHLQVIGGAKGDRCIAVRIDVDCGPCYLHQNGYVPSCKDIKCLKGITVDQVMKAVKDVVGSSSV